MDKKVVIVGCGIAGVFLSYLLARKGYDIRLIEKNSKEDTIAQASKRTYAITIYGFALKTIKASGLWKVVKPHFLKLDGSCTFLPGLKNPRISRFGRNVPYFAVHRPEMLSTLIKKITKSKKVDILFENELINIDFAKRKVTYKTPKAIKTISCDYIIGCDGANSKVREHILKKTHGQIKTAHSDWIYRQIIISPKKSKLINLANNYAYTWASRDIILVAFPQKTGTLTGVLIYNKKAKLTVQKIIARFPNLEPVKEEISHALDFSPIGTFITIHTTPWYFKDFAVILGDAAHAFNPFFGQGVSGALGDCIELSKLIGKRNGFKKFQDRRKIHMDCLGELSSEGLTKYQRETVATYELIYEKIESVLSRTMPYFFNPPIFEQLTKNPGQTNFLLMQKQKQRDFLAKLGINYVVKLLVFLFNTKEKFIRLLPPAIPLRQNKSVLKAS